MNSEQRTGSGEQGVSKTPFAVYQSPFATPPEFAALPSAERKHSVATLWSQTPFAVRHSLFAAQALLGLSVCDPSCGSGHFLLAAARRLAENLAELRAPDGAVRPGDYRHALREVASRCLYGVDINPMAVELCRVALWLETVDPGKPLGFLDHHIRCGNSLLGATPDLIAAGLPDDTFKAIEGDDKAACAELRKRNKKEREGFGPLFEQEEQSIRDRLRLAATQIEAMDDSQPAALQQKEAAFTTSETAPEYRHAKLLADLWCAAFVIKKHYPGGEGEAKPAPSPISALPSPIEGHLLHTQDELFGQPTPAPLPKAANKKQPRTKNQKQGTAWGITTAHLRDFVQGKPLPADVHSEVEDLARQYRFFHWHLAFPQVFDHGGFDCILGNPPWERIKLSEDEWFAPRAPHIANAANSSRRKELIASLNADDPMLHSQFVDAARKAEGEALFGAASGRFPMCGKGDINTYSLFAELARNSIGRSGRLGCVLPSGLATDKTTSQFFENLIASRSLVSLYSFDNHEGIFPAVKRSTRFCLLTLTGTARPFNNAIRFVFYARKLEHIYDENRRFELSPCDIELLNPNTKTCPVFLSRTDCQLVIALYRRVPVLVDDRCRSNEWGILIRRILDMNKRDVIRLCSSTLPGDLSAEQVPVYEAKLFSPFNHRGATYQDKGTRQLMESELRDPDFRIRARYWISKNEVDSRVPEFWEKDWLLVWQDVTDTNTMARTVSATVIPYYGTDFTLRVGFSTVDANGSAIAFLGGLNSFVLDYIARQKIGGTHLSDYILKQLPILSPSFHNKPCAWTNGIMPIRDWLLPRVLELTYTAWDLEAFASDCGWPGPPFRWDEGRRFLLRCELDAAFFHLYLGPLSEWQQQPEALTRAFPTPRYAVSYIMDTFPIVKRKDEAKHCNYRTKETILEIYDALGEAMQSGQPYQTLLNPPPADPACCHPARP